ncbi:MAG: TrkH family potassium uptake protein [Alphaproteobacteria bacterium]|nr:TrkH family potassium uptake protein [Alphaproteobacteria bacterium]
MRYQLVLLIIGALCVALGVAMGLPAIADAATGNPGWIVFLASGLFTTAFGAGLWMASSGRQRSLNTREAFLMTTMVWVVLAGFGALPLLWLGVAPNLTDAIFESMSGLTTTGATVLSGLDDMSAGVLLWRGLLQWFGGLGIVVMAIAVLPMLQIGGMQMFKAEAFDTAEKIMPRAAQIAGAMTAVYAGLTALATASYWAAGMNLFEAIVHGMTTVATGGFSTRDGSIGSFGSPAIDYIAVVFMILGALPFLLFLQMAQGDAKALTKDPQVRAFLVLVAIAAAAVALVQMAGGFFAGEEAVRHGLFSVVSVITGTGYSTANYAGWGALSVAIFFTLTFIGGCAGSTACGIKIFRFQVLFIDLKRHVRQMLYPSAVSVRRYNGKVLPDSVAASVMSFFFIYILVFLILALGLSLTGLDAITALSGAATAISNVGPGLGDTIGPAGNFSSLPDTAKWMLIAGMLLGRLEILTVLVLFLPRFWRR